jgi:methylamine dehydrogenase heavy chain
MPGVNATVGEYLPGRVMVDRPHVLRALIACLAGLSAAGAPFGSVRAQVPIERTGGVETLATPFPAHWILASDLLLERLALVDLDAGRMLGIVSTGYGVPEVVYSSAREELYTPETYYARKTRGERTDVLTVHALSSLAPVAEVTIPPVRAINTLVYGNAAISDDERFVAVANMSPATSLSIVDAEARRFVGEIETPGCSLVYAAGARRFLSLCMDGALLVVDVDADGRQLAKRRTRPFFDPQTDPVTEKAARNGDEWIFVSFEGVVHPVDVSADEVRFPEPWPLVPDETPPTWRVGGAQHLAVHEDTQRLYALMHEGGPDTHKDPGSEVWVYDLGSRERLQRIELQSVGLTIMGEAVEFGRDWIWPFRYLYDGLLRVLPGPGVVAIQVTQGPDPLLVTSSLTVGSLAVYDALSGELRRRVLTGNLTVGGLHAPFGRQR